MLSNNIILSSENPSEKYRQEFIESYLALLLRILKKKNSYPFFLSSESYLYSFYLAIAKIKHKKKIFEEFKVPDMIEEIVFAPSQSKHGLWSDKTSFGFGSGETSAMKKIQEIRRMNGMRYQDSIRAIRLQMLIDHVSKGTMTSQAHLFETLTQTLNRLYELTPPPASPLTTPAVVTEKKEAVRNPRLKMKSTAEGLIDKEKANAKRVSVTEVKNKLDGIETKVKRSNLLETVITTQMDTTANVGVVQRTKKQRNSQTVVHEPLFGFDLALLSSHVHDKKVQGAAEKEVEEEEEEEEVILDANFSDWYNCIQDVDNYFIHTLEEEEEEDENEDNGERNKCKTIRNVNENCINVWKNRPYQKAQTNKQTHITDGCFVDNSNDDEVHTHLDSSKKNPILIRKRSLMDMDEETNFVGCKFNNDDGNNNNQHQNYFDDHRSKSNKHETMFAPPNKKFRSVVSKPSSLSPQYAVEHFSYRIMTDLYKLSNKRVHNN
ncbi:RIO-like kinase domain protein [Reticulomyxa filosa]|uniref:RIO-like kinase domain protein n=1 Tax=Reticulomyxa filosa TaxID=46433 RepID=X6MLT9_RETFI|nr:RIO-like kinase domain protein [Reticulomyxa filosa]|eukprot:ETO14626.1 RIO-like kinase domain protein [Reticulomyxa filosa]